MEQVEVLNGYYTNLDYDQRKEKALKKIHDLSETVRFPESVHLTDRLEKVINIIQENISLFKSVCKHIDIIDTILEYLINYATASKYNDIFSKNSFIILFTLFDICEEPELQSFLLYPIFTNSSWSVEFIQTFMNTWLILIDLEIEMIILEDSDLYAVINYLMIKDNFPFKIWVQDQVKEKFVWLMKRHQINVFTIETFQSLKDIQICVFREHINIVSIWSEDIVAAKNLALSLNSHIIFVNTYMDFSGSMTDLPYKEIIEQRLNELSMKSICENKSISADREIKQSVNLIHFSQIVQMNFTSMHNLFYDGTWQNPVKGMYWKDNDNLWANATNDDIIRCYESAEKGFKIWSSKSIKTRIQILSNLVSTLKLADKVVLAAIVTRWLKFPYLFSTVQGYLRNEKNGIVEIMQVRMPVGVIILREENENVLFFRLMQTLIAGNSVIVIYDANFCNLISYCDMFSTCGIPPGVINLLSHEDTNKLGNILCSAEYTQYADKIFLKGNLMDTYTKPYKNLTLNKSIILRVG